MTALWEACVPTRTNERRASKKTGRAAGGPAPRPYLHRRGTEGSARSGTGGARRGTGMEQGWVGGGCRWLEQGTVGRWLEQGTVGERGQAGRQAGRDKVEGRGEENGKREEGWVKDVAAWQAANSPPHGPPLARPR